MARNEADREDLFAEAIALARRAELGGPGFAEPIVAGFRRDGALSVYFSADPVYHFDPLGRLKRAYCAGRLYRTQGHSLAELTRARTPSQTVLDRRDLPPGECEAFLAEMRDLLVRLVAEIDRGTIIVLRQFPPDDADLIKKELSSTLSRIARLDEPHTALLAPRFKGKR